VLNAPRSTASRGARRRLEWWLHLCRTVGWATREFFPGCDNLIAEAATFLVRLGRVWVLGGTPAALYRVKKVRELYLFTLAHPGTRAANQAKRRLRRELGPLAVVDRPNEDGPSRVRFTLTVLTLMRGVRVPPVLDTGPITLPSTVLRPVEGWAGYVSGFWQELTLLTRRVGAQVEWKSYHLTNKRGPGGGAAILGWYRDLISLPEALIRSLRVVGGPLFASSLDYLLANRASLSGLFGVSAVPGPVRKVVAIQDAEGKSRVIAMVDYFSQTVLRPFHTYLFRLLEVIPQDVTFDQGSFLKKMEGWPTGVRYSVDLSKATDRFPIRLISLLLRGRFSPDWVSAWEDVMVGYPFSSDKGEVSYSVGNPMGAYSS